MILYFTFESANSELRSDRFENLQSRFHLFSGLNRDLMNGIKLWGRT